MRGCAGNGFVLQFFFWCLLLQLNWSAAIYGSQHCCFDSMSDREAVVILDSPRQPLPKRKRPVSFGFILFLFTHTHTPVRHGIGVIVLEDDEEEDHLFMELFSPPRVAIPLRREGFLALHSFDLITGYDLLSADGRARALKLQDRHRPFFTMLSAPCTMYSPMQNAKPRQNECSHQKTQIRRSPLHAGLFNSMLIAQRQMAKKRFFAHEHPQKATSWKRQSVQDIAEQEGVMKVSFDQCCVNLKTPISQKPLQKRTTRLTNSAAIVQLLQPLQCACQEPHATIEGSEGGIQLSKWCQIYTHEFVDKLQKAVRLEWEGR